MNADGEESPLFSAHIAGLQKYLPAAMSMFAPNVNSYRRITRWYAAPINLHWGYDNRTTGLRVPMADADAKRVENRVGGADANPYLAIAASLACGYLGMIGKAGAHRAPGRQRLRVALFAALRFAGFAAPSTRVPALIDTLGEQFVMAYAAVKEGELNHYHKVISSWEREFLLLNV